MLVALLKAEQVSCTKHCYNTFIEKGNLQSYLHSGSGLNDLIDHTLNKYVT